MASILPEYSPFGIPPVSYRFLVTFFIDGNTDSLDIAFQKVSGISADVDVMELREGGQNLFTHRLPNSVKYGNLVLERGLIPLSTKSSSSEISPLNTEFKKAMSEFTFKPGNVLIALVGDPPRTSEPKASWRFLDAYPVKWSISDLDANDSGLVIDTLELAYKNFESKRN